MKDFIVIDWCVADMCNMDCVYCISAGIKKGEDTYKLPDSKTVLDVALRINELSNHIKKIKVNICGGEPLLAENIDKVVEVLSQKRNIELSLITNFKLIDKVRNQISKFKDIFVSLHIKYRTEEEVTLMIDKINELQFKENISLSQVNYKLTDKNISELARINFLTNKSINLQTFNTPIIEGIRGKLPNKNSYKSPSGKYCLIGNMFFHISSDGILHYDLWCHKTDESVKANFLNPIDKIAEILNNQKYNVCPHSYCPCNYNITFHEHYLSAMKEFNPDKKKLFKTETRKKKAILLNEITDLKIANERTWLEVNNLKAHLSATELSFAKLKEDYKGLKSTWSWRIGYYITEKFKLFFGWTPFVRNYLKNKNPEKND